VTFRGFTKFGLSYISELGLHDIDEKDLLVEDISKDQRYQNDTNSVEGISLPAGKISRPKPKKYGGTEKYSTNPRRAKCSLENANFKCELNPSHQTFVNKNSGKQYMEAHHLVPMSKQGSFEFDIDVPENILCVCPNCHRKIHLAEDEERKKTLAEAFELRANALPARGIKIDFKTLMELYSIN
jgi:5-methylcytosine-specific restriction protein A